MRSIYFKTKHFLHFTQHFSLDQQAGRTNHLSMAVLHLVHVLYQFMLSTATPPLVAQRPLWFVVVPLMLVLLTVICRRLHYAGDEERKQTKPLLPSPPGRRCQSSATCTSSATSRTSPSVTSPPSMTVAAASCSSNSVPSPTSSSPPRA